MTKIFNLSEAKDQLSSLVDRAASGEEIVIDCQCINEFAEAATVIQTLRLAGKDNICSSGQKQPMQSR